jgi:hypothetical protein
MDAVIALGKWNETMKSEAMPRRASSNKNRWLSGDVTWSGCWSSEPVDLFESIWRFALNE